MIVVRKQKISAIIPALCILDILMFPYIRALSCSLSMIIILLWYFLHFGSIPVKNTIFIVVPLVVMSVFLGFFLYDSTSGISTALLIIYSMLLFYFIFWCHNDTLKEIISKIIFIYITFVLALSIIYVVSTQTYFSIRSFWTLHGNEIDFNSYVINRFNFIYSDPNNAGCALTAIYAYVLICEKHKMWKYIYYILAISVSVILTMSVQAIVVFGVVSISIFFLKGDQYKIVKKAMRRAVIVELILVLCFGSVLLSNSILFTKILDRLMSGNVSTAGGRLSFWIDTITNALSWENIIIGKGAVIDSGGNKYLPHSGNLHLTISYGFIVNVAYIITMFVLPRGAKRKYYLVLLPFMMIYTINTGVSDYRFITMMAMLSAVIHKQSACELEQIQSNRAEMSDGTSGAI